MDDNVIERFAVQAVNELSQYIGKYYVIFLFCALALNTFIEQYDVN